MKCEKCGEEVKDGLKFCTSCGAPVTGEKKHFCPNCGAEVNPGIKFCAGCGAPVAPPSPEGKAEEFAPLPPSPPPAPAVGQAAAVPPAPAPMAAAKVKPDKKVNKTLIAVIAGALSLLLVVAVVLVIVFVVLGGGGPEATVSSFFDAITAKDKDAAIELIDPGSVEWMLETYESIGEDRDAEDLIEELVDTLIDGTKSVKDLKYKTVVKGDKATVEIVSGTATFITDGEEEKIDYSEMEDDDEATFNLIKKDGKWLLSFEEDGGVDEDSSDSQSGSAAERSCEANLRTIEAAIMTYYAEKEAYPGAIQELVDGDYLMEMPECRSGGEYTLEGSDPPHAECSEHGMLE